MRISQCCPAGEDEGENGTACPQCGALGRRIGRETVGAMAALEVPARNLGATNYRYCHSAGCAVVYYANDSRVLLESDVRVRVNAKDNGPDVPLCYCFGHTRASITAEIVAGGCSFASTAIAREIKAGHCACEVKNPSGRCCLGEVRAFENGHHQCAHEGHSPTS